MSHYRGCRPKQLKRERARVEIESGNFAAALTVLAGCGSCRGYDVDYFELFGRALLGCGQIN